MDDDIKAEEHFSGSNATFKEEQELSDHQTSGSDDHSDGYCTVCGSTFKGWRGLKTHLIRSKCRSKSDGYCTKCGKIFKGRRGLSAHHNQSVCGIQKKVCNTKVDEHSEDSKGILSYLIQYTSGSIFQRLLSFGNFFSFTHKTRIKPENPYVLKCISANADSLLNKFDEFKARVNILGPKIIGISESKANQNSSLPLDGYEIYKRDRDRLYCTGCIKTIKGLSRPHNFSSDANEDCTKCDKKLKATGGVLLYIHKDIPSYECYEINEHAAPDHIWYIIELNPNEKVLIGCIYRRPIYTKEGHNNCKLLLEILKIASTYQVDDVLIMGDFNEGHINWKQKTIEKGGRLREFSYNFLDLFHADGLKQHVRSPTRYRKTETPSLLDLIISKKHSIEDIDHESPLGNSDHCLLVFNMKVSTPVLKNSTALHHAKSQVKSEVHECIKEKNAIFKIYTQNLSIEWSNYKAKRVELDSLLKQQIVS